MSDFLNPPATPTFQPSPSDLGQMNSVPKIVTHELGIPFERGNTHRAQVWASAKVRHGMTQRVAEDCNIARNTDRGGAE